jgi:hypothetical protein
MGVCDAFDQGCDVTVATVCEQIFLPMTGDGAVFNLRGPLANGDGIENTPASVPTTH